MYTCKCYETDINLESDYALPLLVVSSIFLTLTATLFVFYYFGIQPQQQKPITYIKADDDLPPPLQEWPYPFKTKQRSTTKQMKKLLSITYKMCRGSVVATAGSKTGLVPELVLGPQHVLRPAFLDRRIY